MHPASGPRGVCASKVVVYRSKNTPRPSRKGLVRALRAGAVNARRPRGTRGRANAKSIDGAEHSGTLKGVMATGTAESGLAGRPAVGAWPERGHDRDQIQCHDGGLITVQIAVTRRAHLRHSLLN